MSFQGLSGPLRLANRNDPIGASRNPPAPATIAVAEGTQCPTLDIGAGTASDRVGAEVAPNEPPVGRRKRKRRDTDAGPQRAPKRPRLPSAPSHGGSSRPWRRAPKASSRKSA
eukprot:4104338-Pyramimonas_sp.AAC.1